MTLPRPTHHLAITPLYFVRSGYISVETSRLWYASIYGYSWSTTASPKFYSGSTVPSAYRLYFNSGGVGPSDGPYARWYGFPLR